jgi:UDP-glucose 4-epimerase
MKNILVVTGGAGFIGSNLIEELIKFSKYKIISLDNYSSGTKKNHIKNSRIKYLKANTSDSNKILKDYSKNIHAIFHFGEFARIFQSFKKFDECCDSNIKGTYELFKFALKIPCLIILPLLFLALKSRLGVVVYPEPLLVMVTLPAVKVLSSIRL